MEQNMERKGTEIITEINDIEENGDSDSKQKSSPKKLTRDEDEHTSDSINVVSNLSNNSSEGYNVDRKKVSEATINDIVNLGDTKTKKYIHKALDYAVKSGYLKPEDASIKVQSSNDLNNLKKNPSSSSKRVRSTDSLNDDKSDDELHERKKRKISEKNDEQNPPKSNGKNTLDDEKPRKKHRSSESTGSSKNGKAKRDKSKKNTSDDKTKKPSKSKTVKFMKLKKKI